jgi:hypothetical protein
MNLGIYIKTLGNENELSWASKTIIDGFNKKILTDASIFYDDVGFVSLEIPCGMFHSTDLWNFNGSLITLNLNSARTALNIVNNIKLFYYYGWKEESNLFSLLYLSSCNVPFIAKNNKSAKEIYRLTGKTPIYTGESCDLLDIMVKL